MSNRETKRQQKDGRKNTSPENGLYVFQLPCGFDIIGK